MNPYENVQLHITEHGHKQYCQRVGHIAYDVLLQKSKEQLLNKEYRPCKKGYMHLDLVWWATEKEEDRLIFVTCFGKSEWDIPKGLGWAARHHDRIDLSQGRCLP
jgi:hypothetical protein